jgi:hypothetical protein
MSPVPITQLLLAVPVAIAVAASSSDAPMSHTPGPASAGPPWISIEYPANPLDRTTKGAYLLVHAFHHGTPVGLPVRGTAEGIVNGARRTIPLDFGTTSRPGVYALTRQWPAEGRWMLVITVTQGGSGDGATALVRLAPTGQIASVEVPSRQADGWTIPTAVSRAEIDAAVRALASGQAVARRNP